MIGQLDRFKVSDAAAFYIISAILIGLGLDPMQFVYSKTKIHNERVKDRREIGEDVKEKFKFQVKQLNESRFNEAIRLSSYCSLFAIDSSFDSVYQFTTFQNIKTF